MINVCTIMSWSSTSLTAFLGKLVRNDLFLQLFVRSGHPEFPTTDSKNDQIMASNNSLKFKKKTEAD